MKEPLISVIIPVYNGEKFISKSLESVINQTINKLEIIVIDDGSTDSSEEIIRKYTEKYDNIIFAKNTENRGIPYTRNKGLKMAKGDYIAFLDQDDLWLSQKLEIQLNYFEKLKNKNTGLIFSDILYTDDEGFLCKKTWPSYVAQKIDFLNWSNRKVIKNLFIYYCIPTITAIFKSEVLKKVGYLDENLKNGCDDFDFFLRVASSFRLFYIDLPLAIRVEHHSNFTKLEKMLEDHFYIERKSRSLFPFLGNVAGYSVSRYAYRIALSALSEKNFSKANYYINFSLRGYRKDIKTWILFLLVKIGKIGYLILHIYKFIRRKLQ